MLGNFARKIFTVFLICIISLFENFIIYADNYISDKNIKGNQVSIGHQELIEKNIKKDNNNSINFGEYNFSEIYKNDPDSQIEKIKINNNIKKNYSHKNTLHAYDENGKKINDINIINEIEKEKLNSGTGSEVKKNFNFEKYFAQKQKNKIGIRNDHVFDTQKLEIPKNEGIDITNIKNTSLKQFTQSNGVEVIEMTVYAGTTYHHHINFSGIYEINQRGIATVKDHYTWFRGINGITPGYTEIIGKNYRTGVHEYTFKVTVLPQPQPEHFDITLYVGQVGEVILPEEISQYDVVLTNNDNLDLTSSPNRGTLNIQGNKIILDAKRVGYSEIIISEKTGYRFEKYKVGINVVLYEWNYSMRLGETKDPGLNRSDTHVIANNEILSIRSDDVTALKVGNTYITASRNGIEKRRVHIDVVPNTPPVVVNCEAYIGERCHFTVTNGGYYFEQSSPGVGEIDTGVSSFRVRGLRPGTFKVYIKSRYGDFITHIFHVTVKAEPVRYLECSSPINIVCDTNWWGDDEQYTYGVSDANILDLFIYRYSQGGKIYEKLEVTGKQQGTAEVHVYKNEQLFAVFTITVLAPVSPIRLEQGSITLDQGEAVRIKILDGGGEYQQTNYDGNIIHFDVNNDPNQSTNIQKTGEIIITGRNPGNAYPEFKDKYGQTDNISVTVRDTILRLSYTNTNGKLILQGGEQNYEYISIMESVGGVVEIQKNNDNISAQIEYIELNGETRQVIKVFPVASGETVLKAIDSEGNFEEVTIVSNSSSDGGGGGDLPELELELQNILNNFDYTQIENEGYIYNLFEPYISYISTVTIVSNSNYKVDSIEYGVTNLLDDYSEYRYNNSWDEYAEHLTSFIVYYRPEYIQYSENIKHAINTDTKLYVYNQAALNHPDENEGMISEILEQYLPKIQYRQQLNRRVYLTSRQKEINYLNSKKNAYIYTLERAIDEYWKNNPTELEQREQEEFQELMDSFGLLNAGQAWGAIAATVKAEIENDPYLADVAKQELLQELEQLTTEYTSIEGLLLKKFRFLGKLAGFNKKINVSVPLGRGHTGRYIPNSLDEKLALESAISNPSIGRELPVQMTDPRWLGTEGWIKMSQNINNIEIHYVFNKTTKQIDDFKFKD